jgi:hypothetical protein
MSIACELGRVGNPPGAVPKAIARRVELLVAHRVVLALSSPGVRVGQPLQLAGDLVGLRAHGFVAADQIRVRVDEDDVPVAQAAGSVEIEEDRAAAEERLDVAVEGQGDRSGRSCGSS